MKKDVFNTWTHHFASMSHTGIGQNIVFPIEIEVSFCINKQLQEVDHVLAIHFAGIERHGGRIVVSPFVPAKAVEGRALEGNLAIIEFPSPEARDAFWNAPGYRPWKTLRQANATSRIIHIN